MNEFTFGDSEAAKVLSELVSDNKKQSRKVSRILKQISNYFSVLEPIQNKQMKIEIAKLIYLSFRERVEKNILEINDEKIKSHLVNVINTKYKKFIK